ncbi:MAG TPA: YkgJ family cysteine cluster protein [Stenomitos sp.]
MSEPEIELNPPYASMLDFYRDVERNLTVVLDSYAAEGMAPTCQKGCDACCHQMVMTTMAEARAAARWIREQSPEEQERLMQSLEQWLAASADLRRRLQEGADEDLEALVDGLATEYWAQRIPCPFLKGGACSIYEARPLICRHHFSLSDPELCRTGEEDIIERMETMDEVFFFAQDAIPEEEAEIGMFPELVLLAVRELD